MNTVRRLVVPMLLVIGVAAVGAFGADMFVAPRAHDVASPGAVRIELHVFWQSLGVEWLPARPSLRLADMRCRIAEQPACDPTELAARLPDLRQTPRTLYMPWPGCGIDAPGGPAPASAAGFNAEFLPSENRIVIHCYSAASLVPTSAACCPGAYPTYFPDSLLTVDLTPVIATSIAVYEDDRIEHLVGDQSTEFQIASATISGT